MQVSGNTNNYQTLNTQQQAVILPTPQEPKYSDKEIYEGSNGNLARTKDGIGLTPQGQTNVNNQREDSETEASQEVQDKKDAQRGVAVDYLAASSKKSQVEIYLAVATDGKSSSSNKTADVISTLRDVQKQNNAVQAYATYQETQDSGKPALF